MDNRTDRPYLKAMACAAVAFGIGVALLFAFLGSPGPHAGEALGRLAATTVVPAVIIGFFARRAQTAWPLWKIIAFYFGALVTMAFVQAAGHRP